MKEIIIAYDENTEASPVMGDWVGELVRCKDCKYCKVIDWDDSNPYYGSCQYFNTHTVDADGFCYKAERNGSD